MLSNSNIHCNIVVDTKTGSVKNTMITTRNNVKWALFKYCLSEILNAHGNLEISN